MIWHSGLFEVRSEPLLDIYKASLGSTKNHKTAKAQAHSIFDDLLSCAQDRDLFVKDMAYHALPFITDSFIKGAPHVFLTRDPASTIPSLYKMRPDYSEDQPGFEGQLGLFGRIQSVTGNSPLFLNSEILCRDPKTVVSQFFDYVDKPMSSDVLIWPKGDLELWQGREDWHIRAADSQRFKPLPEPPMLQNYPDKVRRSITHNQSFYKALKTSAENEC